MTVERPLHRPAGSLAAGPWSLALAPEDAGWAYAGLRVADLDAGDAVSFDTGFDEVIVLPLRGGFEVTCEGRTVSLEGRAGVFAGPTDFAYAPPGVGLTVASPGGGSVAVPSARAEARLPFRHVAAADVQVELRGAGSAFRKVRRFALPGSFEADRLIASETMTPAGNWSSYPPHKHDQPGPEETALEEIYWFVVADGPSGPGIGYQRVYGSPSFPVDLLAEVRTGDVVLVPGGWHGPSMAAPGYDLYYLNVMAGPERAWRVTTDPAHAWVAEVWSGSGPLR
ncbi:MAG TPA: 5-deoxy-glucuronate isomerase [Candidatus Limnocylindrales bacterium]